MDFSNLSLVTQPKVDSNWLRKDTLGALRVRLSLGRNSYRVKPGLYKLGNPGKDAEVIVTSNYKLSFDIVRKNLKGLNAWILVLETYGINVWCAAGKGTFGTDEVIRQIKDSQLQLYVAHKRVIVPQLGAPGVSGYKVKDATGFSVKFGPVRAEDLKEYLSAGLKKSEKMRSVQFNFVDRLILAPVEIVNSLRYLLYAFVVVFLISGIDSNGYSLSEMWHEGIHASFYLLLAYLSGAFIGPVLLPWLPFRHFGGKGLVAGFLLFGLVAFLNGTEYSMSHIIGWFLISGAVSSFLTMNFTGASTYTSLSGVRKEMRLFIPIQIVLILSGLTLVIISQLK
ncbi:MAG: mercury methylation corrinoid protein HgcA [Bacteroidota bacterium]